MSEIREKYTEVVTQHFLGMTYESRPMYYLKVSEKAESYSLIQGYLLTIQGLVRSMDKVKGTGPRDADFSTLNWTFELNNL